MAIEAGKKAPAFTLTDARGARVSLADFAGKHVVLYFYPKDDTPGCTKEACDFRDAQRKFTNKKAVVLGVSPDSIKSHDKFIAKFDLPFVLLADTTHEVAEAYGAWVWRVAGLVPGMRRSLERLRDHAERSADLAEAAGCSPVTVELIRHQAEPRDRQLGRALLLADEAN